MSGIWNHYSSHANNRFGMGLTSEAHTMCEWPQLQEHPKQLSCIVATLKENSAESAKEMLCQTLIVQRDASPDS
ncbi:hypothetical protein BGZ98_006015, partial [Dissophora globulifera]